MASLSFVSFISAVSYSYPVAEGAPVEAFSEVWPYIFCYFLSVNIWQVWHFTIQCFHRGVEHSLRYFPANLLFFISRKPTSSGSWVLIFSLLSLAWSPCAKVLVCALMESHCCGDWDSCSRTSLLRGLQTSQESNEENWEQPDSMALAFVVWKGPMVALVMMAWY